MDNKLPNVFVNKQIKKANNKGFFYFKDSQDKFLKENEPADRMLNELFVQKKINDIFASPKFIYKVKVLLLTDEGEFKETIIARNHDSLITLNNEKILIGNIKDIKILHQS